ncbi:MAG: hypothetical protein RL518_1032 [Pseudomonadota bacterium]
MVAHIVQSLPLHPSNAPPLAGFFQELRSTELPTLKNQWEKLSGDAPSSHLFDLPDWALPILRSQGAPSSLSAIVARQGQEVIGVLPVTAHRTFLGVLPARTVRGLTPRTELICHLHHRELAARATWECLQGNQSWHVLQLPDVPLHGSAEVLVAHARHAGYRVETIPAPSVPYVQLGNETPSTMPTNSRVYRAGLETKLRKVAQLGELHLTSHQTIEESLARFLRLPSAPSRPLFNPRWLSSRGDLLAHRDIGLWAERCGALRIFSLELNGTPLSMLYGILWRDTFYALRIAHDPRFSMYSTGQLVVMLTLRELARHGVKRCELVGPPQPWKMVWTSTTHQHRSHFIFRPTRSGRTPLASVVRALVHAETLWRTTRRSCATP